MKFRLKFFEFIIIAFCFPVNFTNLELRCNFSHLKQKSFFSILWGSKITGRVVEKNLFERIWVFQRAFSPNSFWRNLKIFWELKEFWSLSSEKLFSRGLHNLFQTSRHCHASFQRESDISFKNSNKIFFLGESLSNLNIFGFN